MLAHVSLAALLLLTLAGLCVGARAEGDVPWGVAQAPWPVEFGNHRVRVRVTGKAEAVRVHLPWRRRDRDPEKKGVVVLDAATGKRLQNVAVLAATREAGDLMFQPETAPGEYYVYYLPLTESALQWAYATQYTPPQTSADPGWLERQGGKWQDLPQAEVLAFEARSEFHRFDPMEVIATAAETQALLARHEGEPYLLFPEDRRYPIRMADDLPLRWVRSGPAGELRGEAQRGEFYAFQIGVYAARGDVRSLEVRFSDLKPLRSPTEVGGGQGGTAIPASALRCINLGGTDWLGKPFRKDVWVPKGKVQALWFGVQVPKDAAPGDYAGTLTVAPKGSPERTVRLALAVTHQVAEDAGDGELWRQARLRWLDSTIGLDDEVAAPYTPLKVRGRTVQCLDRTLRFGADGMPASIRSGQREILARPMSMVVQTPEGAVTPAAGSVKVVETRPGAVTWEAGRPAPPTPPNSGGLGGAGGGADLPAAFTLTCRAKMEADGYVGFSVTLKAERATAVKDIRLEIPFRRDVATYLMGMGRKGGYRPPEWQWAWDAGRANNSVWIGDVDAGLHCKLKGPKDTWDIYNLTAGVPESWGNGGKGGCHITEEGADTVLLRAFSGERSLAAGEEVLFRFGLLITPLKPLDKAHWSQRYYHDYVPVEKALENGANIINVHHGNELNPNINYPFIRTKETAAYVRRAHEKGVKVKIYYTVRELSNYVAELWALRSLGHEVYTGGGGGGHSWLHEHLATDYASAWHQVLGPGEVDAAIVTTGLSRWHNYYLEGLRWLTRNVGIDGLYLDGIGYDREIMKRVRKVMDRERPGCLIDFHSGNEFPFNDLRVSPACKYLEHFPYVNSLWFGEMYDYNETPDYWLVEVSGIPFGLFGEMLQDNGNPWRGMIYGMTARYYSGADPKHLWKLWDDFGIQHARMRGYWDPECPVTTDHRDVLATAYVRKGKTLISVASWAKEPVRVRLRIDWEALGLSKAKANLYAPPVKGFQGAALFRPSDAIPVVPGRGWLFIVDKQEHALPKPVDVAKGRAVLLEEGFAGDSLGEPWKVSLSPQPGTSLKVAEGGLAIQAAANHFAFAERPLPAGAGLVECRVFSGSDKGASWGPGLALVWPGGAASNALGAGASNAPGKTLRINWRAEGRFGVDDGAGQWFGGQSAAESWYSLRIRLDADEILAEASGDGLLWETVQTLPRAAFPGDPVAVRVGKMSPGTGTQDFTESGPAGTCRITALRILSRR